jgi:mono/diheme cytochrome c family protein
MPSANVALSLLLIALGTLAGCNDASTPQSLADPRDPAKVALGRKLYAENCSVCHGARLEGQPNWRERMPNGRMPAPPHDEEGHTWHHTDELLFSITKKGLAEYAPPGYQSDMPAFGAKLSDEEIWAVLSFIASHWTDKELLKQRAEMIRNASRR